MKRLILMWALILVALSACAQVKTYTGSTVTVAWDAPDLGAIPPSEISYEVVIAAYPSGDVVPMATIVTLEQPITFSAEGAYRIGVRAVRTLPDGDKLHSDYSWSDLEGVPQPWYTAYYAAPARVLRVRIK
jgi:hypothetical protein